MFGLIGGLVSGVLGASSANKAAKSQERAAEKQIEFSRETRDLTRDDLSPFYQSGIAAQNALAQMFGLDVAPNSGLSIEKYEATPASTGVRNVPFNQDGFDRDGRFVTENYDIPATYGWRVGDQTFSNETDAQGYLDAQKAAATPFEAPVKAPWELGASDFEASPGYQFRLNQGLEATQASAARRHGLMSGATQNALGDYAQGMASQEYGNWYGRKTNEYNNFLSGLTGIANSGQNAAAGMGAANQNAAQQVNTAYANQGNAQAAGHIGVANALSDGIGNAVQSWQFNNLLNKTPQNALSGIY